MVAHKADSQCPQITLNYNERRMEKKLLVYKRKPFFWFDFLLSFILFMCVRVFVHIFFSQFFTLHLSFDVITLLKCPTNQASSLVSFVYYLNIERKEEKNESPPNCSRQSLFSFAYWSVWDFPCVPLC